MEEKIDCIKKKINILRFYIKRIAGVYDAHICGVEKDSGIRKEIEAAVMVSDRSLDEICRALAGILERYEDKKSCKECQICYYEKKIPVWESGNTAPYIEESWNQLCMKKTLENRSRMSMKK